jgi:hypothetical protein
VYHWEEDEEEKAEASTGIATDDSASSGPNDEKPYWDVPMPSNDELTVQYRFRR